MYSSSFFVIFEKYQACGYPARLLNEEVSMSNKNEAIKDARTLGVPKMLLLGLQHMFAMFGATILVPILVGGYFEGQGLSIQVTLFFAGIGTLFFTYVLR